jgi:hypothetical protein
VTGPAAPTTCCSMRRKAVVGVMALLPEEVCGVSDSEMADFIVFDATGPIAEHATVLRFRFCPWCGTPRLPGTEERVTPPPFAGEGAPAPEGPT